jgi:ribosomal protein uL13
MENQATIINAEGLILGRMASIIAKKLLSGEEVIIVNAEKAVLSGKRKSKIREAKEFLEVGYPRKGPFHYRRPDRIGEEPLGECSHINNQRVNKHTKGSRFLWDCRKPSRTKKSKPYQKQRLKS